MRKLQSAGRLLVLAATVGLSACSGTDEGPLDTTSALAVGGVLAAQIASVPVAFTATDLGSGGVGSGFFSPRALATARWARNAKAPRMIFKAPCPTVDDPTDTDQDGVPDDATFTFTQVDCPFLTNSYVSGSINVQDLPTLAVGYNAAFANFLVHFEEDSPDVTEIGMNGSHGVSGTPATATLTEDLTTTLDAQFTNQQNQTQTIQGSVRNTWTLRFDAAQGQTIVMDAALPDGTFTINGGFVYDVNGERLRMVIVTQTPLVFDAACKAADDVHPFTAGELRAHVQGENANVYVKVTYGNCADPVVEFVGRRT